MRGGDNGLGRSCPGIAFKGFRGDSHPEAQLTILSFIPGGDDAEAVLNRFVSVIAFVNHLPQGGGKDKAEGKEKDFFGHLNHPSICYWKKEAVANKLIIVMRRRSQGCQSLPLSLQSSRKGGMQILSLMYTKSSLVDRDSFVLQLQVNY
jgi:hypothetical protein